MKITSLADIYTKRANISGIYAILYKISMSLPWKLCAINPQKQASAYMTQYRIVD
jgi:hypothetical protein